MRAKIITWNPINTRTSVLHSSVYIKPTLEILEFFNRSPNKKVVIRISDTESCYDNQNMFATIDKSSDVPNKRDNFFDSTGMYVITLNTLWYGFPLKKGNIEFQEGIVNDIIQYVGTRDKPTDKLNVVDEEKETYMNLGINNSDNNDNNGNDNNGTDNNDTDNNKNVCKKSNDNSKGFDNTILIICSMSLLLIMVLVLNN